MQIALRRSLFAPLHYWRTILAVMTVGLTVQSIVHDTTAVLLSTIACAFMFSAYERRRWIVMPADSQVGDVILRLSLALAVAFLLSNR